MIALDYRTLPSCRSPQPLYRQGATCPDCNCGHWHVGHRSAECAHCALVLALAPAVTAHG